MSLYFLCCSVNISVCVLDSVSPNNWQCGCCFVLLLNVMDVFSVGGGRVCTSF